MDLLRVVAVPAGSSSWIVVPDPDARRLGRGAYLHPTIECLQLAERRRAVTRALRIDGRVDSGELARYLEPQRTTDRNDQQGVPHRAG